MSDQPTPRQPDEQHVREEDAGELRTEERVADVMASAPDDPEPPAGTTGEDARESVRAATGAGGSSTADPGRQNPVIPGEGRL